MEDSKRDDEYLIPKATSNASQGQNNLLAKLAAEDTAEAKDDAQAKDDGQAKNNASTRAESTGSAQAVKLLQTMSLWLEGASCPETDDTVLTGWSARYAEQFDQEEEIQVDLAPVLGLPQGADKEELARAAEEQEEDLLKQLFS